jgi:hypothetical protein
VHNVTALPVKRVAVTLRTYAVRNVTRRLRTGSRVTKCTAPSMRS